VIVLTGLLWALAGAGIGLIAGGLAALLVARLTQMTSREGAAGYFLVALALIGALLGLLAGIFLYASAAPEGTAMIHAAAALSGVLSLALAMAIALWSWINLREAPLLYGNAQANLELEFRLRKDAAPDGAPSTWLNIEVQTRTTRPVASLLTSGIREMDGYQLLPAVQGPLYRSRNRVIVARVADRQMEAFIPRMSRKPDPEADWSAWQRPQDVVSAQGLDSPPAILEMRWRVRRYGDPSR
jgi:MFS family permease